MNDWRLERVIRFEYCCFRRFNNKKSTALCARRPPSQRSLIGIYWQNFVLLTGHMLLFFHKYQLFLLNMCNVPQFLYPQRLVYIDKFSHVSTSSWNVLQVYAVKLQKCFNLTAGNVFFFWKEILKSICFEQLDFQKYLNKGLFVRNRCRIFIIHPTGNLKYLLFMRMPWSR